MSSSDFTLPDVGEGLTEAEIVSWRVKAGDEVTVNQVLVEIETAKSLVELPSPFAGTVTAILVEEGRTVDVGTPIITVSSGAQSPADEPDVPTPAEPTPAEPTPAEPKPAEESGAVLVGYGLKGTVGSRRAARAARVSTAQLAISPESISTALPPGTVQLPAGARVVLAKPPIRKLAKDLSVSLAEVEATGKVGEVTRDDVIRFAASSNVPVPVPVPVSPATGTAAVTEREQRVAVKGIRKVIAQAMVSSAFTAPHVSLFVDVDATRTMEFVKRLKVSPDFAGVKVSPLLIVAKAMMWAVRRNPMVNAQWTDTEIIMKNYVNFGIAAATPRGLIVPNIPDADALNLRQLAAEIEQLTLTARDGKTQPAQQIGGTITVTNIGVFGMDTGTPILNPGEAAILAFGTIKLKPWVVDGEVRPRFVTTLGASFDHRIVDGDVASHFLADVASIIEEPALLLD